MSVTLDGSQKRSARFGEKQCQGSKPGPSNPLISQYPNLKITSVINYLLKKTANTPKTEPPEL
jgi:hypothetical protein